MEKHELLKLIVGVTATIALYSILVRENKFYRLFEHIYLGLAVGFSMVALWTENLESAWWNPMIGAAAKDGSAAQPAEVFFALLLPLGAMGFMVFSKKHNWMARIPIGVILGAWGAQQFSAFQNEVFPQVQDSTRVVVPTTFSSITIPHGFALSNDRTNAIATSTGLTPAVVTELAQNVDLTTEQQKAFMDRTGATGDQISAVRGSIKELIGNEVYPTQALNNLIYLFTLTSILSYFLFSIDHSNKLLAKFTRTGRLLMMVGFGSIFGATVMTRFTLLIDRMYFIWIEFLKDKLIHMG